MQGIIFSPTPDSFSCMAFNTAYLLCMLTWMHNNQGVWENGRRNAKKKSNEGEGEEEVSTFCRQGCQLEVLHFHDAQSMSEPLTFKIFLSGYDFLYTRAIDSFCRQRAFVKIVLAAISMENCFLFKCCVIKMNSVCCNISVQLHPSYLIVVLVGTCGVDNSTTEAFY